MFSRLAEEGNDKCSNESKHDGRYYRNYIELSAICGRNKLFAGFCHAFTAILMGPSAFPWMN